MVSVKRWTRLLPFLIVLASVLVVACTSSSSSGSSAEGAAGPQAISGETEQASEAQPGLRLWMETELRDVRTGETFKISDFAGKPVLVESFAVWCPLCTQQQKETKKIHESEGDAIIHVSLDTDPNEDENKVRDHIASNGFEWYYAVSPVENTRRLIDDFGTKIVNAPSIPMVLICEDQSFRMLRDGVKRSGTLLSEVAKGCA